MKTLMVVVTLAGTLTAGAGLAAPLQTLHVTETVEIKARLDKVWATVKDFDGLAKWHPRFARDELISGSNGKAGAMRKLTIKDGPVIVSFLMAPALPLLPEMSSSLAKRGCHLASPSKSLTVAQTLSRRALISTVSVT